MKRKLYEHIMGARYHRYFKWYHRHWGIQYLLKIIHIECKANERHDSWPYSGHEHSLERKYKLGRFGKLENRNN